MTKMRGLHADVVIRDELPSFVTGSYLADDVPTQPDECFCDGLPRHIHHPWGWRNEDPR